VLVLFEEILDSTHSLDSSVDFSYLAMRFSILGAAFGMIACDFATTPSLAHSKAHIRRGGDEQTKIFGYFTGSCTQEKMTIRKEWRHLFKAQQNKFLNAVQCLMDSPAKSGLTATTSRFSDLQALHRGMTNMPMRISFTT
jgi:tyrosinase